MNAEHIYSEVGSRYSAAARSIDTGLGDRIAKAFGYSEEELAAIPKGANLGLSCGNPIAIATIREVCPNMLQYACSLLMMQMCR